MQNKIEKRWTATCQRTLFLICCLLPGCGQAPESNGFKQESTETNPAEPAVDLQKETDSARNDSLEKSPSHNRTDGDDAQTTSKKTNRLAAETSPYLLMHAHNPVDWYPWGEEAFAKARQEGKLLFLSIGYSSCYWCHVMERESFMDRQIAQYLNEHFVCIKVDREERPDLDEIYMMSLQITSEGQGGWPLSMFLTPDGKPFFGGTYFPPAKKGDLPGFLDVLKIVQAKWNEDPDTVEKLAEHVASEIRRIMKSRPVVLGQLSDEPLDAIVASLAKQFDSQFGGFSYTEENPNTPKFPEPSNLVFLLDRIGRYENDALSRRMLITTLEKMQQGGIRDHLGGGFHRYSTDRFWRVPHFEKMLYDNGQLASLYAQAYKLTEREDFRLVARGICDFVLRELTSPAGPFYSSLDAETEGEEGRFYVWTTAELREVLSAEEFQLLQTSYVIGAEPNFEKYHVIELRKPLAELAEESNQSVESLEEQLRPVREKLFAQREKRSRPLRDTKILTSWNGLMIAGLADTGHILNEPRYSEAAARAARFFVARWQQDGRLKRTYNQQSGKLNAYLDDYAFLVSGLIALDKADKDNTSKWNELAVKLTQQQEELFWDANHQGFFFTPFDHEKLLVRSKDPVDGAIPAGNSVAARNLLYLADKYNEPKFRELAKQTLRSAIPLFDRAPQYVPMRATALAHYLAFTLAEKKGEQQEEGVKEATTAEGAPPKEKQ